MSNLLTKARKVKNGYERATPPHDEAVAVAWALGEVRTHQVNSVLGGNVSTGTLYGWLAQSLRKAVQGQRKAFRP